MYLHRYDLKTILYTTMSLILIYNIYYIHPAYQLGIHKPLIFCYNNHLNIHLTYIIHDLLYSNDLCLNQHQLIIKHILSIIILYDC